MARELPSGVVTFLFTDIEGSTRLLQDLGEARYASLQESHRVLVRGAVADHGGVEISTEGDSFFVAFSSAAGAVAAALGAQRALAAHSWPEAEAIPVRMGVHTGEATPRDGNYTALAVVRAARIAAAAHGGQVLVSAATSLAARDLPGGASLRSLGHHRLKDLSAPLELFQLEHPELTSDFPPIRSLDAVHNNLPVQLSSFVGREVERVEVAKALTAGRLVTLTGPGGMGKTRLAYQVAADVAEDHPGGVWVVELAPVSNAEGVPAAVLAALGLREEADRARTDTVVDFLRRRQALVVLDNCEHLLEPVARLARDLIQHCAQVRVLATSREPLHLGGEMHYPVPALGLPTGLPEEPGEILAADAVQLFLTRATEVRPGLDATRHREAIAAICTRLDGLPLAIELAASRVRTLSPAEIRDRLGVSLDLLVTRARDSDARHATLRAAIDWSHELLSGREQVLFRRLAVFAGGWRLDAAEAVCAGEDLGAGEVLDALDGLVDQSLVAVGEDGDGATRYRLLETIGAYAAERLDQAGEGDALADRHAAWCRTLANAADESPGGSTEEAACFDRLDADHANLLGALEHLRLRGDAGEPGLRIGLAARLAEFWVNRGYWRLGRTQLEDALSGDARTSADRAVVLARLGFLALGQGDEAEARARYEEALAVSRRLGDRRAEGRSVGHLGSLALTQGDYPEARARYEEALTVARELGDGRAEAVWVANLGLLAHYQADYPEARARYEEALALARERGDRRSEANNLGNLGNVAHYQADYPEARARYEEALALAREVGDRRAEAIWVGNLGNVAGREADHAGARARYEEALALARELGDRRAEATNLGNLGIVAQGQGDHAGARARYEEALALARELGDRGAEGEWLGGLAQVDIRQGRRSEARDGLEAALGIARVLGVPALAVAIIEVIAALLGADGRHDEAAQLVSWADERRAAIGTVRDTAEQAAALRVMTEARGALGDDAVDHAREVGAALSPDAAYEIAETGLQPIP